MLCGCMRVCVCVGRESVYDDSCAWSGLPCAGAAKATNSPGCWWLVLLNSPPSPQETEPNGSRLVAKLVNFGNRFRKVICTILHCHSEVVVSAIAPTNNKKLSPFLHGERNDTPGRRTRMKMQIEIERWLCCCWWWWWWWWCEAGVFFFASTRGEHFRSSTLWTANLPGKHAPPPPPKVDFKCVKSAKKREKKGKVRVMRKRKKVPWQWSPARISLLLNLVICH